jgi:hypothetical protein
MPKNNARLKPHPLIAEGISTRVYFRDHEQIALVRRAAKHRGLGFNLFIQLVLQASAEKVLAGPPEVLGVDIKFPPQPSE